MQIKSNQIMVPLTIMLSLLLEWCDATKKATMKTTKFTISNQTYSVIVVFGHIDIWRSFSIIQFGGIYIIFLVQQKWKSFNANYTIIFLFHPFGNEFCWSMYLVWPTITQINKTHQQKEHQEFSYSTWNKVLLQVAGLDCLCHFLPLFLSKQKLL